MTVDLSRLRKGEWLAGVSALLALVLMLAIKWYRFRGATQSVDGWNGLAHGRWLVLITVVAAIVLVVVQATSRGPAVPVTMSVAVTLLGAATVIWVGYRVLINPPPHPQAGAFLGLASAVGIFCGGYLSMREEEIVARGRQKEVPTVTMGERSGS